MIANTVYHLLMKNKKGEGWGFKKRERELVNFLPLKRGGGGGLVRGGGLMGVFRDSVLFFFFFWVRRDTSTCLLVCFIF